MKKCLKYSMVFFLNSTYVFSQTYYTGQRVFSDRFPEEIMDYSQETYIKIKNTRGDIIVAIEDVNKRRVIQHFTLLPMIPTLSKHASWTLCCKIYVDRLLWK